MRITRHCLQRMSERGVSVDDVKAALNRPVGDPGPGDRSNVVITGRAMNSKLLCVVCSEEPSEVVVVSVYWSNARER